MMYYDGRPDMSTTVGCFLRSELKKRKLTQAKFAELAHVEDRTVNRWVNGGVNGFGPVETIAYVLRVGVTDIFSYGEDVPPPRFTSKKSFSRQTLSWKALFFFV